MTANGRNKRGVRPIRDVAAECGLEEAELELYGEHKAKIKLSALDRLSDREEGKLLLVSAITPTPAGEGKTTVAIALAMALDQAGHRAAAALRQPSLGPLFGIKGGATGGGSTRLFPESDISLHFTGDLHAVASAHNLLGALIDNHLLRREEPLLDPTRVSWPRVMDMNDRSLRSIIIGLGGTLNGVPRESAFQITASSEMMAILCLAESYAELKERIGNILVGFTYDDQPVYVRDIGVQGAAAALLRDALKPNLVQTMSGSPAFVHGGPFANIAQGTNSIISTRLALKLHDYVVTEAGFGFDLGAEKYFDIVARRAAFCPAGVILVATVRALKMHGGLKIGELDQPDPQAVSRGLPNLDRHLENIGRFNIEAVVAVNRFPGDSEEELAVIEQAVRAKGFQAAVVDPAAREVPGAAALAEIVVEKCRTPACHRYLYPLDWSVQKKIETVAAEIYGSRAVDFTREARADLKRIERLGLSKLPVCIAKTQKSLSDNPALLGRPKDFLVTVRRIGISSGAGFLVPITGDIMLMPGLPAKPIAAQVDIDEAGNISGLFK